VQSTKGLDMKKIVLVTVAAVALMGTVAACGKGKAPPPAAAPIVTKG
jgi:predicted small lipoprotein YifL